MNKTGVGDAQVGAQNIILFPIPKQTQKDGEITSIIHRRITWLLLIVFLCSLFYILYFFII